MVGVPRSTGCRICVQRRIKCDTLRPECSQCTKKGYKCPGYIKAPKFMDERPVLEKRYGKPAKHTPESIDEKVLPSLVSKSMSEQQPTVFRDFILTAFPRFFGLNRNRVHVPWIDYIAEQLGKNPALDKAVYSINSAFMGGVHSDNRLKKSSQEMYGKGLLSFRRLMKQQDLLKSRETLSSCMLFCMFEAYAQTEEDAWIRHAAGACLLMSMRGPKAHLTGFDRCLYLSFRSFAVAHSFIRGTPCLFDNPEWRDVIDTIRRQDILDSRVSTALAIIINFSDRLFLEVVKIPGLIYQTRQILSTSASQQSPGIKQLQAKVFECREDIHKLTTRLQLAVATEKYRPAEHRTRLVGPVPSNFPRSFAASLFRGTTNCLKILDLLIKSLCFNYGPRRSLVPVDDTSTTESDPSPRLSPDSSAGASTKQLGVLPFHIVSRIYAEGSPKDSSFPEPEKMGPVERWLDQIASSLGIGTLDIIVDDPRRNSTSVDQVVSGLHPSPE